MKAALLLSGWPRFHAEFDQQLANLQGADIEWIVTMWKNYPADADFMLNACLTPSFVENVHTEDQAKDWLLARMPTTHKLAHVGLVDWNSFPSEMVRAEYPNMVKDSYPEGIFRQFWMIGQVIRASQQYGPYDLVIRSRPDALIEQTIDLQKCYNTLQAEPNRLIIPDNGRQGFNFNDFFAIATPQAMDIYSDAVNHFNYIYDCGVAMHPENIISHTLHAKGLYWQQDNIICQIRQRGKYLTPVFIRGQKYYESDFGHW